MSGTFPSDPGFVAVNFTSEFYNLSSTSLSGRTQVRAIGGQRWSFSAAFPPMAASEYGPVNAFIIKQRGMFESFQIVLPNVSYTSGTPSGSVTSNALSIGATSVTVSGLTGVLKAGNVFKFANHSKVYMITADRSGNGAMTFEPPLVATVGNGEGITYTAVPFTVRMNNNVQEFKYNLDNTVAYEIDMIEVI
jgi:hypothetical protein